MASRRRCAALLLLLLLLPPAAAVMLVAMMGTTASCYGAPPPLPPPPPRPLLPGRSSSSSSSSSSSRSRGWCDLPLPLAPARPSLVRRRSLTSDDDDRRGGRGGGGMGGSRRAALSRIACGATAAIPTATATIAAALLRPRRCSASDDGGSSVSADALVAADDRRRPTLSPLEARYYQSGGGEGGEGGDASSSSSSYAPPSYGMEAPDVYYPSHFLGTWRATSITTSIEAPCGYDLFGGGKAGYDETYRSEVTGGIALEYRARFVPSSRDSGGIGIGGSASAVVVADREYNAREIAKAAMGAWSVIDTTVATPNRYSCLLAPPRGNDGNEQAGGDLISVDILAIGRRAEGGAASSSSSSESELLSSPNGGGGSGGWNGKFACAEYVRQIVSKARSNNGRENPNSMALTISPLSVKEIETISIYSVDGEDRITCRQRTATYLVPSQTDPIAFKRWQMSRGRAVDVRRYDVTYTRAV